jgi:hypothetical protein
MPSAIALLFFSDILSVKAYLFIEKNGKRKGRGTSQIMNISLNLLRCHRSSNERRKL